MSKDYYQILQASKSATQAELKKAYHKLAVKYHPDKNLGDKQAEKTFKEINEAYDTLKDEQKRAAYDRYGHEGFKQYSQGGGGGRQTYTQEGVDVGDIFGDFFNNFMGGGATRGKPRSTKVRGSDLKYDVSITLEEAFKGIDKNISFRTEIKCQPCNGVGSTNPSNLATCDTCKGHGAVRMQQGFFTIEQACSKCQGAGQIIKNPCNKCQGNGRHSATRNLIINIPAGIGNNQRMKQSGEGEAGQRGGMSGDLYVQVQVKAHPLYKVDGADIHCKLPINMAMAAIGGEIEVPTIDDSKAIVKIAPGTQNAEQLPIKGKGMSKLRSTSRGDMFAHVVVEVPKSLSKTQKELLEALNIELGGNKTNLASDDSFLNKMKNLWS